MVRQVTIGRDQVILGRDGALVASQSQPGFWHVIRNGRCDCTGFAYRGRCRHLSAVAQARNPATQQTPAAALADVQSWAS